MELFTIIALTTFSAALFGYALNPIAKRFHLIDTPDAKRSIHVKATPLTGGIIIYCAFIIAIIVEVQDHQALSFPYSLFIAPTILFLVSLYDDIHHIQPSYRLITHILVASIIVVEQDLEIVSVGNLFTSSPIVLGNWGIPFTIFAIVGLINAFNMIDGLNGLASGISLISLTFLYQIGTIDTIAFAILTTAIIVFLIFNLGLLGQQNQIFLGDSGSTLLGLIIAIELLQAHQLSLINQNLSPIALLFIVALPVLDTISVIIKRTLIGYSIFVADKKHLHHFLLLMHKNEVLVLTIMLSISLVFGLIGFYQNQLHWSDSVLLSIFIISLFMKYLLTKFHK